MTENAINLRVHPAHLIRLFVWRYLEKEGLLTLAGGKKPIVPLNEEPEFVDHDGPYIVYGFANDASGNIAEHNSGVMSFVVYGRYLSEIVPILNMLYEVFKRGDYTASLINRYTTAEGYIGIRFTEFYVGNMENPEPREEEGGRVNGSISISFSYVATYDFDMESIF